MLSIQRTLLLLLFAFVSTFIRAQQKGGTVNGIIYDSINDIPLSTASIVFYKLADSTMQGFQITDYKGAYSITALPVKIPLYFVVSYTGYDSYTAHLQLDSNKAIIDLKTINLKPSELGELSDVVVKAVAPIKMNKDTLEINPEAFKLDSNAVVEDLLLRVPGMVVWSDGTITMNGKKIEKLLVDGKPFFGGDTKIATQNLPKDAIKKIQLYEEKDPSKIQGVDNDKKDSLYSMNVQLKADKKNGLFGKIGGGYGTDGRYDGSAVIQAFNPKNQVGIAFGMDNTNKTDGIGTAAFLNNTFKQSFMSFRYGSPEISGIKKNIWGTTKFQHSFNEAGNGQYFSRLTGDYTYQNTDLNNTNSTDQIDNLIDYKQRSLSTSRLQNETGTHSANLKFEKRNKYSDYISANAEINHTNSTSNSRSSNNVFRSDTAVSYNAVDNYAQTEGNNVNISIMMSNNGSIVQQNALNSYNLSLNASYNENRAFNRTNNMFQSFIDTIASSTIDRDYHNKSKDFSAGASLRYNSLRQLLMGIYNFYNINIGLNNTIRFSRNTKDSRVLDLDTLTNLYVANDYLTNNNTLDNFSYLPGLSFSKVVNKYVFGKYYYYFVLMASIEHRWVNQRNSSSLLYRNISKSYEMWAPSFNANFVASKDNKYRVQSYLYGDYSPTFPSIDELVPIVDTTNRYNVTVGNPFLKVGRSFSSHYNGSIDRAKPSAKSQYGLSLDLSYNAGQGTIIDSIVYDASGKSFRYLLNGSGRNSFDIRGNLYFSSKFSKKYQLQTTYSPSYRQDNAPSYINGVQSLSHNTNFGNKLTTSFIIIDKFNTTLGEEVALNKNSQAGSLGVSPTIKNYTTSIDATYFMTKKWMISSNLNYQSNQAQTNSSTASIWNATTSLRFLNDDAELKFTAFDLLHENKNIVNFLNNNSIGTTITNGLQQYFMLSFSYYPRKFGRKKKDYNNNGMIISR